ncbi:MAG: thioredoxin family protein [Synergistaceae bacterium]|nr:thioredoxin family protein [Synergistaceae bacterium]
MFREKMKRRKILACTVTFFLISFFTPPAFFLEGVKKVDKRITLLVIGVMYCLDGKAVYPYVEAMKAANPFISVRYIVYKDTPGAREFMTSRTGQAATPSIFIVRPGGEVLDGGVRGSPFPRHRAAGSGGKRGGERRRLE